ncbi:MAG: type II secretion system GspH family protein [Candidatus Omnitrophica bacterium]|nr:type II secretion system GspH family protein [Candidatus Omnitrophota bacterium]MBU0895655.1 type II secretion system GspH family protein [Candidatus Omnitrophota bacterium]MBU1038403.1 type II secretion system GspH family protein [Candidatus Omnitrophota bacterium]MBU1808782.1 type II secretion system GspH family protein [Candidatus Omnitrophota bacterium]
MVIRRDDRRAFTLIEIITVVAIIGLLATIAIANFMAARRVARRNACIANLKQIQIVTNTWVLDTGSNANAVLTMSDLVPDYIKAWPKEDMMDYPLPATIYAVPVCPNAAVNIDHTI